MKPKCLKIGELKIASYTNPAATALAAFDAGAIEEISEALSFKLFAFSCLVLLPLSSLKHFVHSLTLRVLPETVIFAPWRFGLKTFLVLFFA